VDNPAIVSTSVGGTDPSYTGTVTALSAGTANVTLSADGQTDQILTFVVSEEALETATTSPASVVITAPQPPAAAPAAAPSSAKVE
jgi:uncharacterized protein YjdB